MYRPYQMVNDYPTILDGAYNKLSTHVGQKQIQLMQTGNLLHYMLQQMLRLRFTV